VKEAINAKRRFVLQVLPGNTPFAEGWTPVAAPISCNFVGQRNAGNVTVQQCTDPDNEDSFDELPAGWIDSITSPTPGAPRIEKGTVLLYLRVVGGNEPGDVRFHFVW
jgi:hypothetical protein